MKFHEISWNSWSPSWKFSWVLCFSVNSTNGSGSNGKCQHSEKGNCLFQRFFSLFFFCRGGTAKSLEDASDNVRLEIEKGWGFSTSNELEGLPNKAIQNQKPSDISLNYTRLKTLEKTHRCSFSTFYCRSTLTWLGQCCSGAVCISPKCDLCRYRTSDHLCLQT